MVVIDCDVDSDGVSVRIGTDNVAAGRMTGEAAMNAGEAGLVECPCIKRNALGAMNALISADMALAGIPSLIPFDETVMAMRSVGRLMSPDLRETARGGCAATPTGRAIRKKLGLNEIEEE